MGLLAALPDRSEPQMIPGMDVYLNGRFVDYEQARVVHDDAGLQHAVGLFETMAAFHGRVFRLEAHLDRLSASARELGLTARLDADKLRRAVLQTLTHNRVERARLRLTVTAGRINLLRSDSTEPAEPTVFAVASEPTQYDRRYFEQGITVLVAPPVANPMDPLAGHKTLAYWWRLRLLRQAASAQAGEVIVLNITNHLASGAISNLCLVKDGTLLTPYARGEEVDGALAAPVLPGITRSVVLSLAEARKIPVEKRMLTIEDLLGADEVFLTNSGWQILPVTRVEKSLVAGGNVGPVTQQLRSALLELIEHETGGDDE